MVIRVGRHWLAITNLSLNGTGSKNTIDLIKYQNNNKSKRGRLNRTLRQRQSFWKIAKREPTCLTLTVWEILRVLLSFFDLRARGGLLVDRLQLSCPSSSSSPFQLETKLS